MKLHLPKSLRAALLACVSLLTPVATLSTASVTAGLVAFTLLGHAAQAEEMSYTIGGDATILVNVDGNTLSLGDSTSTGEATDVVLSIGANTDLTLGSTVDLASMAIADGLTVTLDNAETAFVLEETSVTIGANASFAIDSDAIGSGMTFAGESSTLQINCVTDSTSTALVEGYTGHLIVNSGNMTGVEASCDFSTLTVNAGAGFTMNINSIPAVAGMERMIYLKGGADAESTADFSATNSSVNADFTLSGYTTLSALSTGSLFNIYGAVSDTSASDVVVKEGTDTLYFKESVAIQGSLKIAEGSINVGALTMSGANSTMTGSISATAGVTGDTVFSAATITGSNIVIAAGASVKTIDSCTVIDASFDLQGGSFISGGTVVPDLTISADNCKIGSWSEDGVLKLDSTITFAGDYCVELVNIMPDTSVLLGTNFELNLEALLDAEGTYTLFTGSVDETFLNALKTDVVISGGEWILDDDSIKLDYTLVARDLVLTSSYSGGTNDNANQFLTATERDTLFVDLASGSLTWDGDRTCDAGEFVIYRLNVTNGSSGKEYFFNSTFRDATIEELKAYYSITNIEGSGAAYEEAILAAAKEAGYTGNFVFTSWDGNSDGVNQTYNFSGDMSQFSGDIILTPNGVKLCFIGSARDAISGTGAIVQSDIRDVFYTVSGNSTVKNSSISASNVNFNAAAAVDGEDPSSTYTVSSAMTVVNAVTVAANANLVMASGSSITGTSVTVDAAGSFVMNAGSTLGVSSVSGLMTLNDGVTLNLNVLNVNDAALSLDSLAISNMSDNATITLNVSNAGAWVIGSSYTLIDIAENTWADLGVSIDDFTLSFEGDAIDYELVIVDGKLVLNAVVPSDMLIHASGDITWVNDGTQGSWDDGGAFTNGKGVSIGSLDDATGGTVTIQGEVSPSALQVLAGGNWIFEGTGSITGAVTLVKLGEGSLTINNANSYSGGTLINAGSVVMGNSEALGTGAITLDGGKLVFNSSSELIVDNDIIGTLLLDVMDNTSAIISDYGDGAATINLASGSTLNLAATAGDSTNQHTLAGTGNLTYTGTGKTIVNPIGYSGVITVGAESSGLIIMTSRATADVPDSDRFDLVLNGNVSFGHNLAEGSQSLKMSSLSGSGNISLASIIGGYRHIDIDLLLSGDCQWDGLLTCSGTQVGGMILDSAQDDSLEGSEHYTFTLSAAQSSMSASNNSYTGLHIHNATLRLIDDAYWNSSYTFEDADARLLIAGNDLTFDVKTSGEGADKICGFYSSAEGYGTVEINTDNIITINRSNSSFSGAFELVKGTLQVQNAEALGTASVTIDGGSLDIAEGITLAISNGLTQNAGSITGAGSLSFTAGEASLSGDNTYSGGTTINGAKLTIGHANALGTGAVDLQAGSLTIAEGISYVLGKGFTQAEGTSIIGAGGLTVGTGVTYTHKTDNTFTGGIALNGGSIQTTTEAGSLLLNVQAASTLVSSAASLTLNGVINFANDSSSLAITGATTLAFGDGFALNLDYALADSYTITLLSGIDSLDGFTIDKLMSAGQYITLSDGSLGLDSYIYLDENGKLILTNQIQAPELTWNGGVNGTWSSNGTGWDDDSTFINGMSVIFDGSPAGTVTVDPTGVEVNQLTVESGAYSFAGGSVAVAGALSLSDGAFATFSTTALSFAATANVTIGANASLTLQAQSATTIINDLTNAGSLSSNASLTVKGVLDNSGSINLGDNSLTLKSATSNGGDVTAGSLTLSTSPGTDHVFGALVLTGDLSTGTADMSFGDGTIIGGNMGDGTLVIRDYATVSVGTNKSGLKSLTVGRDSIYKLHGDMTVGTSGFVNNGTVYVYNADESGYSDAEFWSSVETGGSLYAGNVELQGVTNSFTSLHATGNVVTTGATGSLTLTEGGTIAGSLKATALSVGDAGLTVGSLDTTALAYSSLSNGAGDLTINGSADAALVVSGQFTNSGAISMAGYDLELQSGTESGGDLTAKSLNLGASGSFGDIVVTGAVSATGDLTADSLSTVTALSVSGVLDLGSALVVTGADDVAVGGLAIAGDLSLSNASLVMKTAEGATASASSITGGLSVGGDITTNAALAVTGDVSMGGATLTLGGALTAGNLNLTNSTATALSLTVDYQMKTSAIDVTSLGLGNINTLNVTIDDSYLTGLNLRNGAQYELISTDVDLGELTLSLNGDSAIYDMGDNKTMSISVDATNVVITYSLLGDDYNSGDGDLSNHVGNNDGSAVIKFTGDGDAQIDVNKNLDVATLYIDDTSGKAYQMSGDEVKTKELAITQGSMSLGNEMTSDAVIVGSASSTHAAELSVAQGGTLEAASLSLTKGENQSASRFTNHGTTIVTGALVAAEGTSLLNKSSLSFGSNSSIADLSSAEGSITSIAKDSSNVVIGSFDGKGQLIVSSGASASLGGGTGDQVNSKNLNIESGANLAIASGSTFIFADGDTGFVNKGTLQAESIMADSYGVAAGAVTTSELTVGNKFTASLLKGLTKISFNSLSVSNPNAGLTTTAANSLIIVPDAGADYLLSADEIVSNSNIELDLSTVLTSGVANGHYYLIENTSNDISWLDFDYSDLTKTAITNLFVDEDKDVFQATTEAGDIVLVIADSTGYTWTIGDSEAESAAGLVKGDIYDASGNLDAAVVAGLSNVLIGEGASGTEIDFDKVSADELSLNNLSNAASTGDYILSLVGDGSADTLNLVNDKVTSVGKIMADGVNINVESVQSSITLDDGSTATTTGSLSMDSLTLRDSNLTVKDGGKLSINSLTMDAESSLTGKLSLSQGESELLGTFTDATISMSHGASASVDMSKASGLSLITSDSKVNLSHAAGATLGSITASQASEIDFGTLDKTTNLVSSSSITDSTVSLDVTSGMLGSTTALFNVMEYEGTLSFSNSTIAIGLDGGLDDVSLSDSNGVYTLFNLGEDVVMDGSSSIELTGVLGSFFKGASVVDGHVVATRNDSAYNAMGLTENGKAGLNLASKALAATDLADLIAAATPTITIGATSLVVEDKGDLMDIYSDLNSYMSKGATRAADTLAAAVAGATTTSLGSAMMADVERQLRTTRNRTRSMGVDPTVVNQDMPYYNAWIAAEGSSSKLSSDSTYAGHTLSNTGGAVGIEADLNDAWSIGASFTALMGDLDSDGADTAKGDFDTMYASVYARANKGRWNHSFVASYGMLDATLDRTVRGTDAYYTSKGDTSGNALALMYEVGYIYAVTEDASTCIQPVFSVSMVNSTVDGYTETGSDASLIVGDQKNTYVTFGVGAVLESIVGEDIYNRASVFAARVMLKADAGERSSEADVTLTGNTGLTETVKGADVGAIGLELGVGITIPVTEDVGAIFVDASCDIRSGMTSFSGTVGYRFSF